MHVRLIKQSSEAHIVALFQNRALIISRSHFSIILLSLVQMSWPTTMLIWFISVLTNGQNLPHGGFGVFCAPLFIVKAQHVISLRLSRRPVCVSDLCHTHTFPLSCWRTWIVELVCSEELSLYVHHESIIHPISSLPRSLYNSVHFVESVVFLSYSPKSQRERASRASPHSWWFFCNLYLSGVGADGPPVFLPYWLLWPVPLFFSISFLSLPSRDSYWAYWPIGCRLYRSPRSKSRPMKNGPPVLSPASFWRLVSIS